jgi:hypothetical protein
MLATMLLPRMCTISIVIGMSIQTASVAGIDCPCEVLYTRFSIVIYQKLLTDCEWRFTVILLF